MHLLVVVGLLVGLVGLPADARAECSGPQTRLRSGYELPLGCPVVIAVSPGHPTFAPRLTTEHNNTPVDVTGAVSSDPVTVTAYVEAVTPSGSGCSITGATRDVPFDVYSIGVTGAAVDELVAVTGIGSVARIVPAAACPATPALDVSDVECRVSHQEYWDCTCEVVPEAWECGGEPDEEPDAGSSGCAAGSSSAFGLALWISASVVACRRRRARRRRAT